MASIHRIVKPNFSEHWAVPIVVGLGLAFARRQRDRTGSAAPVNLALLVQSLVLRC